MFIHVRMCVRAHQDLWLGPRFYCMGFWLTFWFEAVTNTFPYPLIYRPAVLIPPSWSEPSLQVAYLGLLFLLDSLLLPRLALVILSSHPSEVLTLAQPCPVGLRAIMESSHVLLSHM